MTFELEKLKKMFSIDDTVVIKSDLSKTSSIFSAPTDMKRLKGTTLIVSYVSWSDPHNCGCIYAGGWQWHPDDLYVTHHSKPGKLFVNWREGVFKFNQSLLYINFEKNS